MSSRFCSGFERSNSSAACEANVRLRLRLTIMGTYGWTEEGADRVVSNALLGGGIHAGRREKIGQDSTPQLSLLELAADLANVSRACKVMGHSCQQFYEIRRNFQTYGAEGLIDRLPGPKGPSPEPGVERN